MLDCTDNRHSFGKIEEQDEQSIRPTHSYPQQAAMHRVPEASSKIFLSKAVTDTSQRQIS